MQDKVINSRLFAGIILIGAFLLAFYMAYLVLQGVFIPLLFAILMAVVFSGPYKWVLKKVKNRYLSSIICCLSIIILVTGFISFVVYLAVGEVVSITSVLTKSIDFDKIDILMDQQQLESLMDETITTVDGVIKSIPFIDTSFTEIIEGTLRSIPPLLQDVSSYLISIIKISFDSAAKTIVFLLVFFISFFFLLIDGRNFVDYTFKLLPINALHERQISKRFANLCYSWIIVNLLLALIQGAFAAIGFSIVGVPSPLIWGVVTMLASFIPFVGSGLIWFSIAIIYLILGQYGSTIFLLIWGIVLISSSDNMLRPFLLKEGVNIHPLILFLAVLGGFFAFNIPGFIIGPIIMVLISMLLYIYELEFGEVLKTFHSHERRRRKMRYEE